MMGIAWCQDLFYYEETVGKIVYKEKRVNLKKERGAESADQVFPDYVYVENEYG